MKCAFILLGVTTLATIVMGQTKAPPPRMTEWWLTRSARIQYAAKMHDNFAKLASEIPALSPDEERWLKSEYDDTIAANGGRYTKRAIMATNTRAWDVRVAKPHVAQIVAELGVLSNSRADENWLRDPHNRTQEVRDWTELAALLMDFGFWQSVDDLETRGVVDKKSLDFLGSFHFATAALWAQQMLYEVVLPYLNSESLRDLPVRK